MSLFEWVEITGKVSAYGAIVCIIVLAYLQEELDEWSDEYIQGMLSE